MKLNLGSGVVRIDGFINVDHDPRCNPDYVINIGKEPLPFEDNSVEEVVAHHILEHIGEGFFDLMKDLYRVCENSTVIRVIVPHPRHDVFFGDLTHVRPITVENMRPLSRKWCDTQEYIQDSWGGLAYQLGVDFEIFNYDYKFDPMFVSLYGHIEDVEQINWMARAMNNAITEIHFDMMVIKE